MVDAFLVIVVICAMVITGIMVGLMMIKFGHPDDHLVAKLPKVVTFIGLWLALATILVVPYDVANTRGGGGGVRVDLLWTIIWIVIAVMLFAIIPFAFFFYESDVDPNRKAEDKTCRNSQFSGALCYASIVFVVFATILLIMYAFLNTAEIPVAVQMVPISSMKPLSELSELAGSIGPTAPSSYAVVKGSTLWKIKVSFTVFLTAFICMLGWFFFCLFVGVGMIALPMDLINEFRYRPQPMPTKVWIEEKRNLAKRAATLISIGEALKNECDDSRANGNSKASKKLARKFEAQYYFLKKDVKMLETSHKLRGGNTLWYVLKLILGVIGVVVSLSWIVHICVFILPKEPFHPFLNDLFIGAESFIPGFPLLGVSFFAVWSYYLLWACIKGNFKLGVRFFIWKIYPMEVNNTMMNSFLFNTWILLVCSVPAIQFCATAFPVYTRYTAVDLMFGTQIYYLQFFKYFFANNVFVIVMLSLSFLTTLYLCFFPTDRGKQVDKELADLAKQSAENFSDF